MIIELCHKEIKKEFKPYRVVIETIEDSQNLHWLVNLRTIDCPGEIHYRNFLINFNNGLNKIQG